MKIIFYLILSGFGNYFFAQELISLTGDYLGQPTPGDTPVVFARGIVSGNYQEHGAPALSPDGNEVFWQTNHLDSAEKWIITVMTAHRKENKWSVPDTSSFGSVPVFSPDGKRLYFGSKEEKADPYYIEKHGDIWGEPGFINLITRFPELKFAYNLSVSNKGTLYFLGYAEGLNLWNNFGIYRSEYINGEYSKPELLPPCINTPGLLNWTPFIAPDDSYLIFCSRRIKPKDDYGDLFICFRQADGSWSDRINMGESINTGLTERFPTLSPDGKYLLFTRDTPGYDEDVYWVSAKIINQLKNSLNSSSHQ